ncbi:MAG: DUF2911 domain-containing protein [Rhodothermales bacterium]
MRRLLLLILALPLFGPAMAQDRAAFVTTLGADTLAVERFWQTEDGVEADVVLRTPRTTRTQYRLTLDADGDVARYEAVTRTPGEDEPTRRVVAEPEGDSLVVRVTEGAEMGTRRVVRVAGALPFIDMVHWPFELMLTRAAGRDIAQPLFTERGTLDFEVGTDAAGRRTVTHPFRGTMTVETDAEGRLQSLDAGATTRALTVTRTDGVDLDALTDRFAARDAAGQPFGPLSGRGETTAQVGGATISVDYGQPARRGRDLFGALVPWGELWRTGANRATHLTTDRDLVLGGLAVPAGQYTLFTIPEPDGGVLIVNRETGQNGNSYDPSRDLGRVPMTRSERAESVEPFTIEVAETADGGALRLVWGNDAFTVPFSVAE